MMSPTACPKTSNYQDYELDFPKPDFGSVETTQHSLHSVAPPVQTEMQSAAPAGAFQQAAGPPPPPPKHDVAPPPPVEKVAEPRSPAQEPVRMNDDIKRRVSPGPRQQSLQRELGQSVTPELHQSGRPGLPRQQRSLDTEDAEVAELAAGSGARRGSHAAVRYRPETPRTVTPVRFTPTPRLPNKGVAGPGRQSEERPPSQAPSRNVSDSGISVTSATPEPDDTAGKIVSESMQKIEAQMKRILQNETKPQVVISHENLENIPTVNSTEGKNEQCRNPPMEPPEPQSGYSTCSEEELKFDESALNNNNIPIKTAPFEVMEDFEEAPEEFDLGISSYSISHPVEGEEMEKTPVPEVTEVDSTKSYEDTPYKVSTPSGTLEKNGTLKFNKKNRNGADANEFVPPQQRQTFQPPFPSHQFPPEPLPPSGPAPLLGSIFPPLGPIHMGKKENI